MNEDFVTAEIAEKLKGLGYALPKHRTFALLINGGIYTFFDQTLTTWETWCDTRNAIDVPLWQQAIEWLMDKINNPYLRIEKYADGSGQLYEAIEETIDYDFENREDLVLKLIELCQK